METCKIYVWQYQKVFDLRNSLTDTCRLCHPWLFTKHLIARYNITILYNDLYTQSLPLGCLHLKTRISFMNGSKAETLKCMPFSVKHCPWVGIHGGVCNEQSGESPVRVQQGGESAGDPDRRWGVRRRGSVGPIKEKWLVSCAEETSSGRQNREGLAQAPCWYGSVCSTWGTMSR